MALTDPLIGMPNLRASNQDLSKNAGSALCFLRIPDLDRLSRTYGLKLRIQYKRSLASHLQPFILNGQGIYQLPGFDLVVRLRSNGYLARIEGLEARLKDYGLSWDSLPIHPQVGINHCSVYPPVSHLYELLGEMRTMAEISLRSGYLRQLGCRVAIDDFGTGYASLKVVQVDMLKSDGSFILNMLNTALMTRLSRQSAWCPASSACRSLPNRWKTRRSQAGRGLFAGNCHR